MFRYFIIILYSFLLSNCGIRKLEKLGVYTEVNPPEYHSYIQDSSANIVDVRTTKEYDKSHIHGALNVSYLGGHFTDKIIRLELDKDKTILIYCETQHRSLFVVKKLYRLGFKKIIDLNKGMMYWRKLGFPYEPLPAN